VTLLEIVVVLGPPAAAPVNVTLMLKSLVAYSVGLMPSSPSYEGSTTPLMLHCDDSTNCTFSNPNVNAAPYMIASGWLNDPMADEVAIGA
jgi:hypothetical protein